MAVRLRLKRLGRKKRAFYRLVAIDSKRRRDGLEIERLGWFNPIGSKNDNINLTGNFGIFEILEIFATQLC